MIFGITNTSDGRFIVLGETNTPANIAVPKNTSRFITRNSGLKTLKIGLVVRMA